MKEVLKSIGSDLRGGRSLDNYATLGVASIASLLGLLGVVDGRVMLPLILFCLVLLAVNNLRRDSEAATILQRTSDAASSTRAELAEVKDLVRSTRDELQSWARDSALSTMLSDQDYEPWINKANRISMACIANYRFLGVNSDRLSELVARGGQMRLLLVNWEHKPASWVARERSVGSSRTVQHLKDHSEMTIRKFADLGEASPSSVELRITKYPVAHVINWFEFPDSPPMVVVVPSGFRHTTRERPALIFTEDADPVAYQYFTSQFERLWDWKDGTAKIDLTATP